MNKKINEGLADKFWTWFMRLIIGGKGNLALKKLESEFGSNPELRKAINQMDQAITDAKRIMAKYGIDDGKK